jgi:hypothetical protein
MLEINIMGQTITHHAKQTAYDMYYTDWSQRAYEWKQWVWYTEPKKRHAYMHSEDYDDDLDDYGITRGSHGYGDCCEGGHYNAKC